MDGNRGAAGQFAALTQGHSFAATENACKNFRLLNRLLKKHNSSNSKKKPRFSRLIRMKKLRK
jgi:hypothetical protein